MKQIAFPLLGLRKIARIFTQEAIPVVLTSVFLGTTSLAQSTNSSAPLRFTVPPAVATPIHLKTLPNAVCTLHPEGSQDAAHSLKLYADGEGMIHFHARPHVESDVHAFVAIDCSAGSEVSTHRIELRGASAPTSEMPTPSAPQKAKGPIRPALTNDQLNSLSDEELMMAHYPPRPDPKGAPGAYAAWLTAVSRPTALVAPKTVQRSDVAYGPFASPAISPFTVQFRSTNWSGFALLPYFHLTIPGEQVSYNAVSGLWQVPSAAGEDIPGSYTETQSTIWVGLDGVIDLQNPSNKEIPQVGTSQNVVSDGSNWDYHVYLAWYTWHPIDPQLVLNFQVNPWDVIMATVRVGRNPYCIAYPLGTPRPHPVPSCSLLAYFFIENLTTGEAPHIDPVPVPPGRTFSGTTAEWIMERPGKRDGTYYDLSKYDTTARMYYASAGRTNGQWLNYNDDLNEQFTMVSNDGRKVLSTVTPIYNSSMQFTWYDYK